MAVWLRYIFGATAIAIAALIGCGTLPAVAYDDEDTAQRAVEVGKIRPFAETLNPLGVIVDIVQGRLPGRGVRSEFERKGEPWLSAFPVMDRRAQLFDVHDQYNAQQAVKSGKIRPLADILKIVRGKLPGEVVRTELEQKGELWLYEFRVVDRKGQLFEVYVDARSGEIQRVKEK